MGFQISTKVLQYKNTSHIMIKKLAKKFFFRLHSVQTAVKILFGKLEK